MAGFWMSCPHKFCQALSWELLFLRCWFGSCSKIDLLSKGNSHPPDLECSPWNSLIPLIGQVLVKHIVICNYAQVIYAHLLTSGPLPLWNASGVPASPLSSGLCYEYPSKSCHRGFCNTDILFEFCRGLSTECLVKFQVNENLHSGWLPAFQQKVVVTATHNMLFSTPNFSLLHALGNVETLPQGVGKASFLSWCCDGTTMCCLKFRVCLTKRALTLIGVEHGLLWQRWVSSPTVPGQTISSIVLALKLVVIVSINHDLRTLYLPSPLRTHRGLYWVETLEIRWLKPNSFQK